MGHPGAFWAPGGFVGASWGASWVHLGLLGAFWGLFSGMYRALIINCVCILRGPFEQVFPQILKTRNTQELCAIVMCVRYVHYYVRKDMCKRIDVETN